MFLYNFLHTAGNKIMLENLLYLICHFSLPKIVKLNLSNISSRFFLNYPFHGFHLIMVLPWSGFQAEWIGNKIVQGFAYVEVEDIQQGDADESVQIKSGNVS